jgi:hypothetical protein
MTESEGHRHTGELELQWSELLETLRASGAAEHDPVRFAYLEALVRRAAAQPEAIRQRLNAKLEAAVSELAARPAAPPTDVPKGNAASPLAELLTYIGDHAHVQPEATNPAADSALAPHARQTPELKSVAWFHETWSKLSTEQQLTQTLAQAPENAGPMNSQHLVLRSLQAMRDIAPDYLQSFMSYIDTLIWLEHAAPTKPTTARSPVGEGESKKPPAKRGATRR